MRKREKNIDVRRSAVRSTCVCWAVYNLIVV